MRWYISGDLGRHEARFGARSAVACPVSWRYGNGYSGSTTWYRLKRQGETVPAYQSLDGIVWYAVAQPLTVPMSKDIHAGMAVSSNNDQLNKAAFDNVTIEHDGPRGNAARQPKP